MSGLTRLQDAWESALHRILRHMPVEWVSAIGSHLVRFNVRHFRKDILAGARRNLAHHRPQLSPAELDAGVDRFVDNVGRFMAEFAILHRLIPEGRSAIANAEPLKAYYGRRPILALSLHTSNWETMGAGLQLAGFQVATFYEPPESPVQRRIAEDTRIAMGFKLLTPDLKGLRESMRELRKNHMVAIFADEARSGRTMAPLFGRPPHAGGNLAIAARLAREFDCVLVTCHAERHPGCRFTMHYSDPFFLPAGPGRTLLDDVAFLNDRIEPIILANIDRWYFLDDSIEPLAP